MHSSASDGQLRPSEVVFLARQHHLDAIALTDHDCTDGLAEALAAAEEAGVIVLPGVELSTEIDGGELHVLGYLFDPQEAALQEKLYQLRNARRLRAEGMVARLAELGLPISLERVLEIAGVGAVGRPHVAQALLETGHVATLREAFDRYIGNGGPAYVSRMRLTPPEAIALIHAAGGVAVMAHPIYAPDPDTWIATLAEHGLDGLEVYYPDHDADFTRRMRLLARRHDLIMTGGSDFHRRESDGGVIMGTVKVPPECVMQLMARAVRYRL